MVNNVQLTEDEVIAGLSDFGVQQSDLNAIKNLLDIFGSLSPIQYLAVLKPTAPSSVDNTVATSPDWEAYKFYRIHLRSKPGEMPGADWIKFIGPLDVFIDVGKPPIGENSTPVLTFSLHQASGTVQLFGYNFDLVYDGDSFTAKITKSNITAVSAKDLLHTIMGCQLDLPLDGLSLVEVEFRYLFVGNKVITLNVKTKGNIDILKNGLISISDPGFHIQLWDKTLAATKIFSKATIDSKTFDVSASYDPSEGVGFEFSLSKNYDLQGNPVTQVIDIHSISKSLMPNVPDEFLPNISINDLDFSIQSRAKIIHFKIAGDWTPGSELSFILPQGNTTIGAFFEITTSLDKSGDGSNNSMAVGANYLLSYEANNPVPENSKHPAVEIRETVTATISAILQKDINGVGYSLSGTDLNLNLGDMLVALEAPLKSIAPGSTFIASIKNDLDSVLSKFTITGFTLSHNATSGTDIELKIGTDLKFSDLLTDLGGGNPLPTSFDPTILELDLTYTHSGGTDPVTDYSITSFLTTDTVTPALAAVGSTAAVAAIPPQPEMVFKASIINVSSPAPTSKAPTTTKILLGNIYGINGNPISLGSDFPLNIEIKDLFLANITPNGAKKSTTVFGTDFDVSGSMDLTKLDVVGHFFSDVKFSFDALRIIYASDDIDANTLVALNDALQTINVSPLTNSQSSVHNNNGAALNFPKGMSLQGNLTIGDHGEVIPLYYALPSPGKPVTAAAGTPNGSLAPAALPVTTAPPDLSANTQKPAPVGKQFGPVHINSVSLGPKNGGISFTVTGGIQIGPIEVDLIGFSIESPIPEFDPKFDISGMAIKFNKPPISIDGEFAKQSIPMTYEGNPITVTEYSGGLCIALKSIQILAIGSYAKLPDCTSMFFFGVLSVPIAIPPIGILESVGLGFGMNRNFTLPGKPENIGDNALIVAMSGALPAFSTFDTSFPISKGENWLAFGLRLLVLDMVDATILLIVKWGHQLEFDILGKADMSFPKVAQGTPALCRIIIGVEASIIPDEGLVVVNGGFLKGSYIYCPEVQITGGFAMLSISAGDRKGTIYEDAVDGEFMLSLGGYSPFYTPKSYYPVVPRLALTWKPTDSLSITAQAYCTITPDAFMLGGHIIADFNEGGSFSISVHFELGADFIVWFKPYHYKGDAYMSLVVKAALNLHIAFVHIHIGIELDLHADVIFWGPSFAGHADVSIHYIVSFSASVNFGPPLSPPPPLVIEEFNQSFFSDTDKVISTKLASGMLSSVPLDSTGAKFKNTDNSDLILVNPKELELIFTSAIPIKSLKCFGIDIPLTANDTNSLGISAMGNTAADFSKSEFTLSVTKEGSAMSVTELKNFNFTLLNNNYPSGMWQAAATSGVIPPPNSDKPLMNLCSGISITPIPPAQKDAVEIPSTQFDDIQMAPNNWNSIFNY